MAHTPKPCGGPLHRRSVVKLSLGGLCWAALSQAHAAAQGEPASMRPQVNDLLVKVGDKTLTPLKASDIPTSAQFVSAWPMDPTSKVVRSGSRLNELLVVRIDPKVHAAADLAAAAGNVLAFSALCTHAGCNISTWAPDQGIIGCDCHASEFDAKAAGKPLGGPASRALPPLALKLDGDTLVVAKPFATAIRFDEAG